MFYIIWRTQDGKVGGFITDDEYDNFPISYETEKEAEDSMKGHILESVSEIIKLD